MITPRTTQAAADVAGHYDELDRVYREIWGDHVHHGLWRTGRESSAEATDALADMVGAQLSPASGDHAGDIGCGYGATAARLAARHGVKVTGLSLSAAQLAVAQARPGAENGTLQFLLRDWLDNGLADGLFDRAYAIESSEHMVDKQRFFDEAARTVRPGGRLVVCAWLARETPSRWEIDHLLEPICREGRLPGMGSRSEYEAMAGRAGFRPIGYADIGRQVQRTWDICAWRLAGKLVRERYYRRLVLSKATRNRSFILSLPRLMLAYRTGAMRYGVFTWQRAE